MPGKLCTGAVTGNSYLIKDTKAFSEGLYYRAGGTLLGAPIADNPHEAGSGAANAWDNGWTVADNAALSTIDPTSAPCVAVPTNTVAA